MTQLLQQQRTQHTAASNEGSRRICLSYSSPQLTRQAIYVDCASLATGADAAGCIRHMNICGCIRTVPPTSTHLLHCSCVTLIQLCCKHLLQSGVTARLLQGLHQKLVDAYKCVHAAGAAYVYRQHSCATNRFGPNLYALHGTCINTWYCRCTPQRTTTPAMASRMHL